MADAAVFNPQVLHAQLLPKALCPKQVAVPLKHALDEVILDLLHGQAEAQVIRCTGTTLRMLKLLPPAYCLLSGHTRHTQILLRLL